MPYLYNFPNGTTPDTILSGLNSELPLISGLLFFTFMVIWLGGSARQRARTGMADYAMWGTVAGLATFILSLLLGVLSGYISLTMTIIIIVVTLGFALWLFLDKKPTEI